MRDGGGGSVGGSIFDFGSQIAKDAQQRRNATRRATGVQRTPRRTGGGGGYTGGGGYVGGGGNGYSVGLGGGGGGRLGRLGRGGHQGAPSLNNWLARDTDYQDQLRAFNRSLSDFMADVGRRKTSLSTDYSTGVKRMGEQRVKDLADIMNDFASRGLLKSGLFGQRQGDYEKQYQQNLTDLSTQNKKALTDLSTEEKNYRRQQELQKESARKEAARRRAEKYGI